MPLAQTIGHRFPVDPFHVLARQIPCVPLSHPSGVSAWNHIHKDLVEHALQTLQHELLPTSENTV